MGSGVWNNCFLPHTSGEEPESGSAVWQLAMKLWYIRSDGMLLSVICHPCLERDGLCSVLLHGQSRFGPHFTTEALRSSKSTYMKGPKQLWPPSLTLLHRFPCIFVSVPSHIWHHLHHLLVVAGASQSNASHHSSGLPQKQFGYFIQTDSFGDFAKMTPAVGGLAGYQAWGLRAVGTVLFLAPHLPRWPHLQPLRLNVGTWIL